MRILVGAVGGEAAPRLLAELGVSRETLVDASARVPAEVAFRGFERAVEITGDELVFLKAGAVLPLGALEVLDFAVRSSASLGEAMQRLARYYAFVDDASTLSIVRDGDTAAIVGARPAMPTPRPATELLFAIILARGKDYIGRDWPLREVRFAQSAPRDPGAFAKYFSAPAKFGQSDNRIIFDAAILDAPCRTHDPALAGFLERQLDGAVAQLPPPKTFLDQVRAAIASELCSGEPLLAATAARLAITGRTLQRRLSEHDTSHRKLVEDVRREVAERLLARGELPIGEIAFLAGFSDPTAFHHAFVRWNGVTPKDYVRSGPLPFHAKA
ncbi:MAG: AraC family transcriptional regulator [Labilithrix sp.]